MARGKVKSKGKKHAAPAMQTATSTVHEREEAWTSPAAAAPTQAAESARATVGLDSLLQLMARARPDHSPETRFLITSASYRGQTEREHVRLMCEFRVQFLTPGWGAVWLLPHSVALSEASVDTPSNGVQATIGAMASGQGLIVSDRGEYTARMTILVPYTTARNSGFMIDVPRASRSQLSFTVTESDVDIHVDPALGVQRASAEESTTVTCELPPTRALSVQWSERLDDDDDDARVSAPLSVNAECVTVLDVGDTVVNVSTQITFTIRNGSAACFEVLVDRSARVFAVDGLAIKRWEKVAAPGGHAADKELVRVYIEYGLEDLYVLSIMSEMDLTGSSNEITAPTFTARNVERQKGFLCVQARSNVEVSPITVGNLTLVDVTEVPDRLVSNPLFVYKFLDPDYELSLSVRRHKDVDVLIAVVEAAHVVLVHNEEGRTLTKLVADVRNTQLQFLRIKVPEESEVLSAVVAGLPAKPAEDATGLVMIPLQKSTRGADAQQDSTFTIELVYLSETSAMANAHRRIGFRLPTVDIPCNKLYVTAYLPEHFQYGQFTGDLREVAYHSGTPPQGGREASREQKAVWGRHQLQVQQQQISNMASNPVMNKASRKRAKGVGSANRYCGSDAHAAAFAPVKVDLPEVGTVFRFEQVLVANARLELAVDYTPINKGYCDRRRVDACLIL